MDFKRLLTGTVVGLMAFPLLAGPTIGAPAERTDRAFPVLTPAQVVDLREAIVEMTRSPRGPYLRIRWFCADGTVLPPEPYACRPHGGGFQHAQIRPEIASFADLGFHFGTIYRALEPADVIDAVHAGYRARELVVQAYLARADDGWVMRRARFYRGARQAEDEERAGLRILQTALSRPGWARDRPMLASRLVATVPHAGSGSMTEQIRTLAVDVAELDPALTNLRVKLHSAPGPADIETVRLHLDAIDRARSPALAAGLEELLEALQSQFGKGVDADRWLELARATGRPDILESVRVLLENDAALGDAGRLGMLAGIATASREAFDAAVDRPGVEMLALLELAGVAADRAAVAASAWLETIAETGVSRRRLLGAARLLTRAAYADGWLTSRERNAQEPWFARLLETEALTMGDYHSALRYMGRMPGWAHASTRQTFAAVTDRYIEVEPAVHGFEDDLLRGSALLPLSTVLSMLAADAGMAIGQEHEIFDARVRTGVLGLNPGVAVGPLYVAQSVLESRSPDPRGIYVLPETPPELGRIAGILTLGQGSRLSHVQLLARGLGIPNAAIDPRYLQSLTERVGEQVVYSVSPLGSVHLDAVRPEDLADLERLREGKELRATLRIDEGRLDLSVRDVLPLEQVEAADAGRIAGPKAANLGQLHQLFPDRVAPGLVVPFGVFRAHIERVPTGDGPSLADEIRALFEQRTDVRERLAAVRARIESMPLLPDFERQLRSMLAARFGEPGTYGVFVRSDTNVEDLPNFSGAGLNLTVMNVIGTQPILDAIRDVWASPFTERAYGWRSEAVANPEAIYPSIVILGSVPSEASGVLVTRDVDDVLREARGSDAHWTVTLSPGVGGGVGGEETETTLVTAEDSGEIILLSASRTPWRKVLRSSPPGGILDDPVGRDLRLLTPTRLADLRSVIARIIDLYPAARNDAGEPMPWDVEFGFLGDRTVLFQIRPFIAGSDATILDDARALDARMEARAGLSLDLDEQVNR